MKRILPPDIQMARLMLAVDGKESCCLKDGKRP